MGTDAATPFNRHGENAQELAIMVELGMTPMAAILATTAVAARAIGRDDIGILAPGKLADLAVWRGDPLADVRVLESPPLATFLGGTRIA
jgi:imidazolonepropionase-like amidohydrolase